MMSQPCAAQRARDLDGLGGLEPARPSSRSPRCAPTSACAAGHAARTASKTSSGKRSALLERAAVLVGRDVGERREEARQQVAVRHVQLEQVEARLLGHAGGARRSRRAPVHVGAVHLARHLAVRLVRDRRRGDERPVAARAAARRPLPQPARRALAAGVRELQADPRRARARARSRRCASRRATCSGLYMPVQPGLMRPSRLTSVISVITSAGAADRAAAEVHEVPVVGRAVLGRVLAHRRDHDAVGEHAARAAGTA